MTLSRGRSSSLPAFAEGLWALVLVAAPFLLFREAFGLWWTEDDFFQLRYALEHGPAGYGLDSEIWRRLPNRVLSPLLFVSYELDLALFGLRPEPFYAHQLASIGLAAATLYGLLRLWLAPAWAALGGAAFLLGAPTASLASHLMVRHYPEAVVLGLATAAAWVTAVRSRRRAVSGALAVVSALLYLAASLAKEIAVPLPLFLALVPEGDGARPLRLLVPHAVALALYSGYRVWMLGAVVGGYGFVVGAEDLPRLILELPWKAVRELAPAGGGSLALLAVVLGPVLVLVLRNRRAALLVAGGTVLALAPVLPVAVEFVPRYAVALWLGVAAALPFALASLARSGRTAAVLAAACLVACAALGRGAWEVHHGRSARLSAEYRALLALGPDDLLRRPLAPPASVAELRRFARDQLDRPAAGGWFYDDLYLCGASRESGRIYGYDRGDARVEDITARALAHARRYCASIRWDAPLTAELAPRPGGVLAWRMGPYETGDYAFVLDGGRLRYDMPRDGAFHLGGTPRLALRVRYRAPEGWVTYSPELEVDLRGDAPTRWRRGERPPGRQDSGGPV